MDLRVGATRVWSADCCPVGMTSEYSTCLSEVRTPFTAITDWTEGDFVYWDMTYSRAVVDKTTTTDSKGSPTTEVRIRSIEIFKNTTVVSFVNVLAQPVEIYWQEKDLSLFPTDYASSLATKIGVRFPANTPPPASPASPPSIAPATSTPEATHNLSTATRAGIGVGSVLGALALVATIVTLIWWRIRRKRGETADIEVVEMEGSGIFKKFLRGKWRSEVGGRSEPVEMDARGVRIVAGPPAEME
ncbi:hypothetical protein DM02DRAFT_707755 [Periconia macrospinosa]|uniref:Uncharacterized protein n=1 Tax=Periconia macrospinosa TaxID=97972 RepID=A0A2V1DV45_9PLEO|nr:hypothetical protein DM02DRAFT_707755 [Periconia macrospinosa]